MASVKRDVALPIHPGFRSDRLVLAMLVLIASAAAFASAVSQASLTGSRLLDVNQTSPSSFADISE
jgi:hypothetical protein